MPSRWLTRLASGPLAFYRVVERLIPGTVITPRWLRRRPDIAEQQFTATPDERLPPPRQPS